MHGNVAEWCLDGTEGAADYPAGPVSDPVVIGGTFRRMRGGGWMNIAIDSRSAIRLGGSGSHPEHGFELPAASWASAGSSPQHVVNM
jgi:formylglycine-generating enzyme required for sulfatase activity